MNISALKEILLEDFIRYLRWSFKTKYNKKIILTPSHIKVAKALIRVYTTKRNLIINLPPRFGKTEMVNTFIEWTITKHPGSNNILTSYSDNLVMQNSQQIRDMLNSHEHKEMFDIETKKDTQSKKLWKTDKNGGVYAVSSFGQVTGFGAGQKSEDVNEWGGCIVIDDPLKPSERDSLLKLEKVKDWYETTLTNRRNTPNTPIILIMQRIHVNDIAGHILNNEFDDIDGWDIVKVSILDEDDCSVWEDFYPAENMLKIKKTNPSYFSSQMQQEPVIKGGNLLKSEWVHYISRDALNSIDFEKKFITADTALKDKEKNDYTVYSAWGVKDNKIYYLDMFRGKPRSKEREVTAKDFYNRNNTYPFRGMFIEQKASGIDLFQRMKDDGFMVYEIERSTDKIFRAENVSPYIEIHGIYVVDDLPNVSEFMQEYQAFPNAEHDDIVDTVIDAFEYHFMNDDVVDYGSLV